MEIKELAQIQREFDAKHGWDLEPDNPKAKLEMVNKDLIGLFGEIGEFANLIKKLNIEIEKSNDTFEPKFFDFQNSLNEELIDSFIYLFRIATHLDLDIEDAYLKKLSINREKYRKYEE
jgi:NTP pyrophosphatase (non-canonical NTP hydrolase)